jgi:hypothetical protein
MLVKMILSIYVSQEIHGKDLLINYQSMGSGLLASHTTKKQLGSTQM